MLGRLDSVLSRLLLIVVQSIDSSTVGCNAYFLFVVISIIYQSGARGLLGFSDMGELQHFGLLLHRASLLLAHGSEGDSQVCHILPEITNPCYDSYTNCPDAVKD